MPREKRAANASSKREKAELAELAERVLSEAPAKGSNPLLAEGDNLSAKASGNTKTHSVYLNWLALAEVQFKLFEISRDSISCT